VEEYDMGRFEGHVDDGQIVLVALAVDRYRVTRWTLLCFSSVLVMMGVSYAGGGLSIAASWKDRVMVIVMGDMSGGDRDFLKMCLV
jgi:hypothetical protein